MRAGEEGPGQRCWHGPMLAALGLRAPAPLLSLRLASVGEGVPDSDPVTAVGQPPASA